MFEFWYGQAKLVDGVSQETCRDLGHVQYGLGASINAGQTATIQSVPLLEAEAPRILAAMEFHARFLKGAPAPDWLCGGKLRHVSAEPMWEVGYNAFPARGHAMPEPAPFTEQDPPRCRNASSALGNIHSRWARGNGVAVEKSFGKLKAKSAWYVIVVEVLEAE